MILTLADVDRSRTFKLEEIYNQNAKLKKEDVKALREWARLQPHLPEATESQLIIFLHSCYYSLEAAKVTMDKFFTCRTLLPEFFGCLPENELKQTMATGCSTILPKNTPDGNIIWLGKLLDFNADNYNFHNQCNCADLTYILHNFQNGLNNGVIIVMDAAGLTFNHLTKFGVFALKNYLYYIQEAAPIRIKGIHFININSLIEKIFSLMKPFLKKDLLQIFHFHQGIDGVFDYAPKHLFPADYGGEGPSIAALAENNQKNILDNLELFKILATQKVDESRRPKKSKTEDNVFGIDGSFKKLNFD